MLTWRESSLASNVITQVSFLGLYAGRGERSVSAAATTIIVTIIISFHGINGNKEVTQSAMIPRAGLASPHPGIIVQGPDRKQPPTGGLLKSLVLGQAKFKEV